MGLSSLPYPYLWSRTVLLDFIQCYTRATEYVTKKFHPASSDIIISWIQWNDPTWKDFKKLYQQLDMALYSTYSNQTETTTRLLSSLIDLIEHGQPNLPT